MFTHSMFILYNSWGSVIVNGIACGNAEGKLSFAGDINSVMPFFITVEALRLTVTRAVSLMGLLLHTEVGMIFSQVALATLKALDCIMWHGASVSNVT